MMPKHDWGKYLENFNLYVKPVYSSIFTNSTYPGDLADIEKTLASGFSAKHIQKKFLTLAILANGTLLAKNLKLAEQLANEANYMIGGIIGSPSLEVGIGLLLLSGYYCGVGDLTRSTATNALAYQICEILDISKMVKSVNGFMYKDTGSGSLVTVNEEAIASLKARVLSKMIMNTPDPEDREHFLAKAMKLPSNRMELFFVLHSYIVAKARDKLPDDPTQATNNIIGLFTWVEKADGIVREFEGAEGIPSWVGAMLRTMLDSCKVCLLHKMGLREEAITLAEKTRAMIEKEMLAKHYGLGYQCATIAISKVYEQLNQPELMSNFLHTLEYVADVFVSMKLKLSEAQQVARITESTSSISLAEEPRSQSPEAQPYSSPRSSSPLSSFVEYDGSLAASNGASVVPTSEASALGFLSNYAQTSEGATLYSGYANPEPQLDIAELDRFLLGATQLADIDMLSSSPFELAPSK